MKLIAIFLLSFGITFASFADGPDCKNARKSNKEARRHSRQNLKRVVNANPQHKGYPKADQKGNYPAHVDRNVYYVPE